MSGIHKGGGGGGGGELNGLGVPSGSYSNGFGLQNKTSKQPLGEESYEMFVRFHSVYQIAGKDAFVKSN